MGEGMWAKTVKNTPSPKNPLLTLYILVFQRKEYIWLKIFDLLMHTGCVGGVCSLANVLGPALCSLGEFFKKGDLAAAQRLQQRLISPNACVSIIKKKKLWSSQTNLEYLLFHGLDEKARCFDTIFMILLFQLNRLFFGACYLVWKRFCNMHLKK